ncbi:MAG: hydroxymethylpyrimidine/phosphomethylpyrimidine kinase [Pseudomonadota bacterium]|nr:hydroxymethylpyrimidine/phosphomethylpyrimidine kinase [Pseudomonadota bacterium]MDE3037494.1 hydroxymethylpyrimidine/phosphomethylpyrimidine kinase [Pseudomonadota bacterium]
MDYPITRHRAPGTERSPAGRVLVIAGSDSGGGAGIQGDIKTVTTLGGYAATAITALTAQNTWGVFGIHDVPSDFIRQQISLVLDDIGADVVKTGMLHKASVIETVAECLASYSTSSLRGEVAKRSGAGEGDNSGKALPLPNHSLPKGRGLILDPVMFAKGGAALLAEDAIETLKIRLIPLAAVVTPNIPEAEYLSGISIGSIPAMRRAAEKILALGCQAVLLKGGHLEGKSVTDMLMDGSAHEIFTSPRIISRHTHGTGCALASAMATSLAQGMSLRDSVIRAREYVRKAIENAPGLGKGHGPLGHFVPEDRC